MKCSVAFWGPEQVKELSHGDAKPFPGIVDRRTVNHPQCEPDFAQALNLRYRYAYSGPAITALISPSSEPWMFNTLVSWFFVPPWHDGNSRSVPLRFLVEEDQLTSLIRLSFMTIALLNNKNNKNIIITTNKHLRLQDFLRSSRITITQTYQMAQVGQSPTPTPIGKWTREKI
ncbi:hypothetical protein BO86DRAFT_164670 [Aspergillus japonicus CBS 114.51]|uniref:Uncharacterized protein n=1 Tax=Aspergillus japonicus CBS 114.51 TaxID=1448312 RepID=A0A8T8XBV6_ASPJA|nr:hypothetical protein BO86DRAFT_164670 [Aspergillus japonicus CBS 114.51]RAH85717.1 hypothetical protein BO86DRAFT_164670 [Aspergillus japonicus CBS 114.51]